MLFKRSIKFHVKNEKKKGLSLRLRIRIFGVGQIDIPFPYRVKDWDGEKTTDKAAMRVINEWLSIAEDTFTRYDIIEKRVPTLDEVKSIFLDTIGTTPLYNSKGYEFRPVFDTFLVENSKERLWTQATITKLESVRKLLQKLGIEYVNDITLQKAQELVDYMLKNEYKNTTTFKYVSFVRWFLRWAASHNYYTGNVHTAFHPKLKGVSPDSRTVIYLSKEEILQFLEYDFKERENLSRVRDVFVFCCFCGLRYSDVKNLKRSDIYDGCINIVTQKTSDSLHIELNKYTLAILEKYKDEVFPHDAALPVISNVHMNQHLKEAARIAGINTPIRVVRFQGSERIEEIYKKYEVITTHCARRSFVVIALQLGISENVIMKWTGHSSHEAIKPYISIVDELRKRSMNKFNQL